MDVDLKYERLCQIGEGTYGKVYKARCRVTGRLVALKRIRMETEKEGFPLTAMREIKLLKRLERVENVVKLLDICTCQDESVYLVMEYLEYDLVGLQHYISLSVPSINVPVESSNSSNHHRNDGLSNHSHVRSSDTNFVDDSLSILKSSDSNSSNKILKTNMSPKNSSYIGIIKCILKQTLTALRDLHEHERIIHRDIKGSNILVNQQGTIKLADFGLAKFFSRKNQSAFEDHKLTLHTLVGKDTTGLHQRRDRSPVKENTFQKSRRIYQTFTTRNSDTLPHRQSAIEHRSLKRSIHSLKLIEHHLSKNPPHSSSQDDDDHDDDDGKEYKGCRSKTKLFAENSNEKISNTRYLDVSSPLSALITPEEKPMMTNRVVTLWYRPPELLLGSNNYGTKVDIWGVGCVLLELLTGSAAFMGNDDISQLEEICRRLGHIDADSFPVDTHPWIDLIRDVADSAVFDKKITSDWMLKTIAPLVGQSGLDFAIKLLQLDPSKRPSAQQLLKHHWLIRDHPPPTDPSDLLNSIKSAVEIDEIPVDQHEFDCRGRHRKSQLDL